MKKILSTLSLLALTACASSGIFVDDKQLAGFRKGETTSTEVINTLGRPSQRMTDMMGNTTLGYSYFEHTTRPQTFIPVVGAFVGGADSRSKTVMLTFGPDDKLLRTFASGTQTGTGMGFNSGVHSQAIDMTPRQPDQSPVGK